MNSFRTYLTELFEQPFTLHRVANRGATLIQYQYRINPKLDDTFENRANSIAVNFQLMGDTVGEVEWEIDFVRGGEVRRTGEGNASRVFATVLSAIRHFVGTHPADVLSFTAAKESGSESRVRLYSSLVKRFASEMGYELVKRAGFNRKTSNIVLFVLRKATP